MPALDYCSYLLRIWQVPINDEQALRIQLENVQTGEKHGFTSLKDLLDYLSRVIVKKNLHSVEGN